MSGDQGEGDGRRRGHANGRGPGTGHGGYDAVSRGLSRRLRLPVWLTGADRVFPPGLFALVNGFVSIAIMAALAHLIDQPFVFPSLGPTAYLIFYGVTTDAAAPRNAIYGHAIGAAAGFVSLALFRLVDDPAALASHDVTWARVGAAALSLGLTAGFMVWLRVPHAPAGATTLIVSLGIIHTPLHLGVLMLAVVLLVLQGIVINRWIAGVDYPLWRRRRE